MIIVETEKRVDESFKAEMIAAGVPAGVITWSTRRKDPDTGAVTKGHPRALIMPDVDASYQATVEQVLADHVPNFGHVQKKVAATKKEAYRRIVSDLPEWKQRNYTARAVEKLAANEVGDDEWKAMQQKWEYAKDVRTASDQIEARIQQMTDAEAGAFDVTDDALWPAT